MDTFIAFGPIHLSLLAQSIYRSEMNTFIAKPQVHLSLPFKIHLGLVKGGKPIQPIYQAFLLFCRIAEPGNAIADLRFSVILSTKPSFSQGFHKF